jgi:hypothetical protein
MDHSVLCFKAISTFVTELATEFGPQNHPIELYGHLVQKTTFQHEQAIVRHCEAFRAFCVTNRDAIIHKDASLITEPKIEFSPRVYIDIQAVFELADADTKEVIWEHLLTISAIIDPTSKAKQILGQSRDAANEANFLESIIDKVESEVSPSGNPMDAIGNIMGSGFFNDLIGSMNNGISSGQLDIGKLMGVVQNMVSNLDPQSKQMAETLLVSQTTPTSQTVAMASVTKDEGEKKE